MVQSNALFLQLAIVLGLAALAGYATKLLRLPLLVAYLLAGVLLAGLQIFDTAHSMALTFLPEIGMAFVLFFIGMELDLGEIRDLGKPVVAAGLGQIVLSVFGGFLIATALGLPQPESIFLGIGLSFSSTIVVVKLLLEKRDLSSLYGKLSLGILLLEDLVAILILMGLSVEGSLFGGGIAGQLSVLSFLIKGALLFVLSLGLSRYVLAGVFKAVAKSSELLFLSALAWCFIFVAFSISMGFSVVIGAFLAGVALANSPFHYEIQGKVKPLRDFFVTLFFVYLGSQVVFIQVAEVLPLIIAFTLYALIVKPIIFLLILGSFGFKKHTLFQTALNLSQVSEFSLIILMVGLRMGLVPQSALTAMALTGVISIIISSIMISASRIIYPRVTPIVGFFEAGRSVQVNTAGRKDTRLEDHVILIGAHRMGGEIVRFLKREGIPFLVLDFNPAVIQRLINADVHALYGDIGDPEILEFLNLGKAKLIISTAQSIDDNLILLSEVKRKKFGTVVVVRATTVPEAQALYKAGADYVVLPEIVSGDFITNHLKNHWPHLSSLKDRRDVELHKLSRNYLAIE